MKKILKKKLSNEKGLTLVELLAVIVILGIIAAIAIPAIGNVIENSRVNAIKADALNVLASADLYLIENPESKGEILVTKLVSEGYLDSEATFTKDTTAHVNISNTKNDGKDTSIIKKTFSGTGTNGKTTFKIVGKTKNEISEMKVSQ